MGRSARNLKKLKAAVKQYYELIALYLVCGHKNIYNSDIYEERAMCCLSVHQYFELCVTLTQQGLYGAGELQKEHVVGDIRGRGHVSNVSRDTVRQLHLIHNPSLTETRWCRPNIVSYPTPNYLSATQSLSPRQLIGFQGCQHFLNQRPNSRMKKSQALWTLAIRA